MSLLEKFVDSLEIKLGRAYFLEVLKPFSFHGSIEGRNIVIQLNKGEMYAGSKEEKIKPDSFYFIPQRQASFIKLGNPKEAEDVKDTILNNESKRNEFLHDIKSTDDWKQKKNVISIISFEVILYNAFPFFPLLGMAPFQTPYDEEFSYLVNHIGLENEMDKLGKHIIMKNYIQEMVIHLCRYIDSQPKLREFTEKLNYLTDKRLIDIVHYVQENLGKDLSNKAIALVAHVSEDYVGQFFKSLTNRNLQDYVEDQRLEKAMQLLKSMPDNVQEISAQVGFRDPAYFSRRFKLKFGINANFVRLKKDQVV